MMEELEDWRESAEATSSAAMEDRDDMEQRLVEALKVSFSRGRECAELQAKLDAANEELGGQKLELYELEQKVAKLDKLNEDWARATEDNWSSTSCKVYWTLLPQSLRDRVNKRRRSRGDPPFPNVP